MKPYDETISVNKNLDPGKLLSPITLNTPQTGSVFHLNAPVYARGSGQPNMIVCISTGETKQLQQHGKTTILQDGSWQSENSIPTNKLGTQTIYVSAFVNGIFHSSAMANYTVKLPDY